MNTQGLMIIVSLTSSEALLDYVEQMEERDFNIVWNTILEYIALSFLNCIRAIRRYTCISWLMLQKKVLFFLDSSQAQYLTWHPWSIMGNVWKQGTLGVAFGWLAFD